MSRRAAAGQGGTAGDGSRSDGDPSRRRPPSRAVDAACDRFEAAWKQGRPLAIEALVAGSAPEELDELLPELIALEVHYRLLRGEVIHPGEYEARFPGCLRARAAEVVATASVSGAGRAAPASLAAGGTRWGKFELLEQVGKGAFGTVWRARDLELERIVALKVLHEFGGNSPAALARYRREAKLAARLSHPAIARVHEVVVLEGRPTIVSEFVDGPPLDELAARRPLDMRLAAALVADIAEALDYAHSMGVVHRDVKPANVIVQPTPSGMHPVVVDFGLARHQEDESLLTLSGEVLGTPAYMSPEQASGRGSGADGRTDVYALGVVLFELTTGYLPFHGLRGSVLEQVLRAEPRRPRDLNAAIPADLETITLKAMEKSPAARYATARDLADDLRRWLRGEPVLARPVSNPERVLRWCRRNPLVAAQAAVLFLLMLVVAIGASVAAVRLRAARDRALISLERAERAEREAKLQLWEAHLSEAAATRLTGVAGRRYRALAALDQARVLLPALDRQPERRRHLRNEYVAALALADLGPDSSWTGMTADTTAIAFDPGLERYAQADLDSGVGIRRVGNGQQVLHLPVVAAGFRTLAWSEDGRLLLESVRERGAERPRESRLWAWERGEVVLALGDAGWPGLSPDGRYLAAPLGDRSVAIHDLANPGARRTLCTGCDAPAAIYRPGGGEVALLRVNEVEIREVAGGRITRTLGPVRQASALAWGGEGGELIAVGDSYDIHLWDVASGHKLAVLKGHQSQVVSLAFSHRGDLLASQSWDGTVRLWDVPGQVLLVTSPSSNPSGSPLTFSRDDRRLAFSAQGTRLGTWQVEGGRLRRRISGGRGLGEASASGDLSPDGRLIAVAGRTGAGFCTPGVRLWDLASGRLLGEVPSEAACAAVFTPGGDGLIVLGQRDIRYWPIGLAPTPRGVRLSIGHSRILFRGGPSLTGAVTRDGRLLVAEIEDPPDGVLVLPLAGAGEARIIEARTGRWSVAVSGDGRWVATGVWHAAEARAQVFDAASGALVVELPVAQQTAVGFSPDGLDLVTSEPHGCRFYRTGTWDLRAESGRPLEGAPTQTAFTPAGDLVAAFESPSLGFVRLIDPGTGEAIASVRVPDGTSGRWLHFSPDGGQLLVGDTADTIHIWDLALLRRELRQRDLDWPAPSHRRD